MFEIPIVLFAYNRPEYLAKTLASLMLNEGAHLHPIYIYCDGARPNASSEQLGKINHVRSIAGNTKGFKETIVKISSENKGLVKSITSGITDILTKYPAVIVMEDDLVTGKYFLKYMRDALLKYEHNERVISIHGFNHHIAVTDNTPECFFLRGADCWGWATWRRGWALYNHDAQYLYEQIKEQGLINGFDFNGTYPYHKMLRNTITHNNSWAIRWYASAYLLNKLTLYPAKTLVKNIGEQGSNFKTAFEGLMGNQVSEDPVIHFPDKEEENVLMRNLIAHHFRRQYSLGNRIWRAMKYFGKKLNMQE